MKTPREKELASVLGMSGSVVGLRLRNFKTNPYPKGLDMAETNAAPKVAADADDKAAPPPVKTVSSILMEHRGGGLHNEASEELQGVVKAVKDTQKKGSLTITISVEPAKDDEDSVVLSDTLKVSAPRPTTKPSRWFTDEHGNVSRTNPRQGEISGLRDVSAG